MNKLSIIISILLIMLFTACSSNGIASAEEEQGPSCNDITRQISYEYFYGNNAQEQVCNEYRRILSANGISANSTFAHNCLPSCWQY